jgi:subtilisin family serine protease
MSTCRTLGFVFALALVSPAIVGKALATDAQRNPITVYTGDTQALRPGGAADRLMQAAREQGQIRVIVGLRMTMQSDGALTTEQAETQARALESMQGRIAARVLGSSSAQREDRFTFIPYMSLFVTSDQLRLLMADPDVVSIQEDDPVPPTLNNSAVIINANDVWVRGFVGAGQTVAVLDTGAARTHPMFAGKLASEACFSTTNAASNVTSLCPQGLPASIAPGSGSNCPVSITGCDHGTHVAGIAIGRSSVRHGIARGGKLISIQVFSRKTTTNSVTSFQTDQIKGLQRVFQLRNLHKIAAVNMSLGGGFYSAACDAEFPAIATAITSLRNAGIATVIASGNNGYTGFVNQPACISTAVAVGNTTKTDLVMTDSNHANLVKLLAPGTAIGSAVPGGYGVKTGTSMAAPHVAGALALLRNAKPAATVDDMLEALTCSGKVVNRRFKPGASPLELDVALPRIDVLGAYNYLRKPPNVLRIWRFDTVAEAADWSPVRGNWRIFPGNFVNTPLQSRWAAIQVANCNTKLQVTARLRRIDPDPDQHWNSGIFFKTTTDFRNRRVAGYWAAYNDCPTNSAGVCTDSTLNPPGQAVLWRIDSLDFDSNFTLSQTLLCVDNVPIALGGYNVIRVVSNGPSHSYYLNNRLVCTVNDTNHASGAVLLAGAMPETVVGHYMAFDSAALQAIGTGERAPAGVVAASAMDPSAYAPTTAPSGMSIFGSAPRSKPGE